MELQVKNGLSRYGHRDPVLKGVGFRFGDGTGSGRILAVLGPNGAGKTTLIRLLLGHLRWTEGETLFGGRKAASLSPAELARLIGYVPQAKVPPFAVTVLEMTELGRIAFHGEFGEPDETDEAAALEALDTVGIRHLAGRLCRKPQAANISSRFLPGRSLPARGFSFSTNPRRGWISETSGGFCRP